MTEQSETIQISEHLLAALEFQSAGISVVPAQKGKRPIGEWKQYQSQRAGQPEIIQWFGSGHSGLGIVTGAISGNLEMVEAEGRAVTAGLVYEAEEIAKSLGLQELWNRICDGYFEITPSGGYHWLYRCTEPVEGNLKLAERPGAEDQGREVLFETRGEGGFVVVAPTSGDIHPSQGTWQRQAGSPAQIATITPEERTGFLSIFRALDQMPKLEPQHVRENYHNTDGSVSTGDDYNRRESWENILEPHGWRKAYQKGTGEQFWTRPGKDFGVSASTGRTENDNLFVFTTSTEFDAGVPYSKFAAYALMNFGGLDKGSFQQARKQLMAEGYGDQVVGTAGGTTLNKFEPDFQLVIDEETGEILESSWKPADIEAHLSGSVIVPVPGILVRDDLVGLLYSGRVHSFYGESESGKSWVAQYTVAELLKQGQKACYIDFEADVGDIISRLQLLGVPNASIASGLTYIKPESRPREDDPFWQWLLGRTDFQLVVIDGVTESLTIWGGETKDNDSITAWMRHFPKRIASRTGAAVVTIDHVNKSTDTRGRFAIGGQAKLAALDGAAFLIEPLDPLAPGRVGSIAMRVTKDRPGGVRKHSVNYRKSDRTQEAAIVKMDATGAGVLMWVNVPLTTEERTEVRSVKIDDAIREVLASGLEYGANEFEVAYREAGFAGTRTEILTHLKRGAEGGWLVCREGANRKKFYSLPSDFQADFEAQNG